MQRFYKYVANNKHGEIALALTLLSFGLMLIGTMVGGVYHYQTTQSRAAGNCTYDATAKVINVAKNGETFTKSSNNGKTVYVTTKIKKNGFQYTHALDEENGSSWKYYVNPLLVNKGEQASVTLSGLDEDKWNIVDTSCEEQGSPPGNTCKDVRPSGDLKTLNNFTIDCGVNIKYYWYVEPAGESGQEPTPTGTAPTSRPFPTFRQDQLTITPVPTREPTLRAGACIFNPTSFVKLRLDDGREIPLTRDKEPNITNWTTQNNAGAVSIFKTDGTVNYRADVAGRTYCCGTDNTRAGFDRGKTYVVGTTPPDFNDGHRATVKLTNYQSRLDRDATYTIVKKCGYKDPGCTQTGKREEISGLPVGCANGRFSYQYGWVLQCSGKDCYGAKSSATRVPLPSSTPATLPLPTSIVTTLRPSPTVRPTNIPSPIPSGTPRVEPSGTAQYNRTIPPMIDTYTVDTYPDTNYGKALRLRLGGSTENQTEPGVHRTYLRFELSELANFRIRKAELSMYPSDRIVTGNNGTRVRVFVHDLSSNWEETTLTWNSTPTEGRQLASTIIGTGTGGFIEPIKVALPIDIVQNWANAPAMNYGIVVKGPQAYIADNALVTFISIDETRSGHSSLIPYLYVEYDRSTNPVPAKKTALSRKDLNGDGSINVVDFVLIVKKIGTKGKNIREDFNNDGVVNAVDVASLIVNFGKKLN